MDDWKLIAKRARIAVFLCGMAVACLGGCQKAPARKEPIRMAFIDWPGFYQICIADQLKFFENEGVSVETILCKDNPEMIGKFEDGEVDGMATVLSDCIQMHVDGIPIKVVYVADYSDQADVILAQASIARVEDLRGKRVSFERINSFSHLFVLSILERHGLGEAQVRLKPVPAMEVLADLDSGEIAAGHTWEPVTSQALAKGYRVLATAGDIPGIITDVIAFRGDLVATHRSETQKIVNGLVKAQRHFMAHPDEDFKLLAAVMKRPVADLKNFSKGVHLASPEDNRRAFSVTGEYTSLHESGRMILNFLANHGRITNPPGLNDILDASFVNEAAGGTR